MKIIVSGSSGLIGSALTPALQRGGHTIVRLVRGRAAPDAAHWDPKTGTVDTAALEGAGAVVHLAGESVAGLRWTRGKKRRIRQSRVRGTALLAQTLAALERKPEVLLAASGVGYYGDQRDYIVDEDSDPGYGFLADVCREWEAAARPAVDAGIRVVHMRFGVVLSDKGGALATMLRPFRYGLGGAMGEGTQYMSWIALDDAVGAIEHLLTAGDTAGPVNVTTPNPVTNREFTDTLARTLHRPAKLDVPAFVLRLLLGRMADEMLLASTRVHPERLIAAEYVFRLPTLEAALRDVVRR